MNQDKIIHLVPGEFYLVQNYPEPFSSSTKIKFCIANRTRVRLEVYDAKNNMILLLMDEEKEEGTYEVQFSDSVPDGIYFYQLWAGDFLSRKKMMKQTES